jgi:AraC family transcriptional regulator, transcriptional activator FtrA
VRPPVHVVIWLPSNFYSAVAATMAEMLELVNTVRRAPVFSVEFVSRQPAATATTGIRFPTRRASSRPIDVLILLAMPGLAVPELVRALETETPHALRLIEQARLRGAIIAAHCGASYFLAASGLIDRKRATISWWLKAEASRRFPNVRWDPSRVLVRQGKLYTCGGGFSGLELARALLQDLGLAKEERIIRKLLVLPPSRQLQTPYEFALSDLVPETATFESRLGALARSNLAALSVEFLASKLGLSTRTLARRFAEELHTTPGQWIQDRRLDAAKSLLEQTRLTVSEICYRIGYQDVASFSRLFSAKIALPPGEYRRQSA